VHVRARCTDLRNPPANLLDIAREKALKRLKAASVNGKTLLALPGDQRPTQASLAPKPLTVAAPATAQPAPAAGPGGFM
jgi:hypothetical protein